jgi:hypothetical protein
MRKKTMMMLMMLSLLIVAGLSSAQAQISRRLEVNIPFKFTVGDTTLPAGKYYVKQPGDMELQVLERRTRLHRNPNSSLTATGIVTSCGKFGKADTKPEPSCPHRMPRRRSPKASRRRNDIPSRAKCSGDWER